MKQVMLKNEAVTEPVTQEQNTQEKLPLKIPDYLKDTYHWAYVNPKTVFLLDRTFIVWAILWGNSGRLMRTAFKEITSGEKVLQAAYVYGDFSFKLAQHVGEKGQLDVIDILPIQVENCKKRLKGITHASVRQADAAEAGGGIYDTICCYFLLHEVPYDKKTAIVRGLLGQVASGGKVVFVDYHKPARFHPLKQFMYFIWRKLEPYALDLVATEIKDIAGNDSIRSDFKWTKETLFGGLYQKVVATRE